MRSRWMTKMIRKFAAQTVRQLRQYRSVLPALSAMVVFFIFVAQTIQASSQLKLAISTLSSMVLPTTDTTRTAPAFRVKDKATGGGIVGQEKHVSSLPTFTFSRARIPLQPMSDVQYHSFDTPKSEIEMHFTDGAHLECRFYVPSWFTGQHWINEQ